MQKRFIHLINRLKALGNPISDDIATIEILFYYYFVFIIFISSINQDIIVLNLFLITKLDYEAQTYIYVYFSPYNNTRNSYLKWYIEIDSKPQFFLGSQPYFFLSSQPYFFLCVVYMIQSSLVGGVEITTEIPSPKNGVVETNPPKKSLISFVFQGTPVITTSKLNGNKNYLNWYASVELWFLRQRLSDHLTKKVYEIDKEIKDDLEAVDYQLISLFWNSIKLDLMAHFRAYKSCYKVWQKAKNLYANDIERMYASIHNLATLQMNDQ